MGGIDGTAGEIDYSQIVKNYARYEPNQVDPDDGAGGTVLISVNGGQKKNFPIPVGHYNLARSWLEGDISIPVSLAGKAHYFHMGMPMFIEKIELFTNSEKLVEVDYVNKCYKMLWGRKKVEEVAWNIMPLHGVVNPGQLHGVWGVLPQGLGALPVGAKRATGDLDIAHNQERGHLIVGASLNGIGPDFHFQLFLGDFMGTLLELDKDLPWSQIANLKITFAGTDGWVWDATSITLPAAGTTVCVAAATIENLKLMVQEEQDQSVKDQLDAVVRGSGLKVLSGYLTCINHSHVQATNHSVKIKINQSQFGDNLLRITHGLFSNTQTKETSFDTDTNGTLKLKQFYTKFNHHKRQTNDLYCNRDIGQWDDWNFLQPYVKGTMNGLTPNGFAYDHCFIDNWAADMKEVGNVLQGIPITGEFTWDFIAVLTQNLAFQSYTAVEAQRMLNIDSSGIHWVDSIVGTA